MRSLITGLYVLLIINIMPACGQKSFDEKLESLYNHTVPLIQPAQLEDMITESEELVILDIRSRPEYRVSKIAGAQFIDYDHFSKKDVRHISKDKKIIVYCSVGYRSEKIGEKLLAMGYSQVYNIYGGIFQWKNDGYQVINQENQPTDSVHTYNKSWSKWLIRGIKVY
ncbi:MAG: rhodanese-like domain-containing protein [Candidatus Cyclobacteriaceae bacterium M3_2C_046]